MIINQAGGNFINDLMEKTGLLASDVVKAYIIAWVPGHGAVWTEIDAVDNKVPARSTQMRLDTNQLTEWVTLWFLRNGCKSQKIASYVDEFIDGFRVLYNCLGNCLPKHYLQDIVNRAEPYVTVGVPKN